MGKPLQPPLAVTKPCANCQTGHAVGMKRLCDACRKANNQRSREFYTDTRSEILALRKRVEALEAILASGRRLRAISGRAA